MFDNAVSPVAPSADSEGSTITQSQLCVFELGIVELPRQHMLPMFAAIRETHSYPLN